MAWDSHLRAYTGWTFRRPGEEPLMFKNHEEYTQWQHAQRFKERLNKRRAKAAEARVRNRPETGGENPGREGKGAAKAEAPISTGEDIIDDEALNDLFMSAPGEITWSSEANEAVVGERVEDGDLHDMFMAVPDEITWDSDSAPNPNSNPSPESGSHSNDTAPPPALALSPPAASSPGTSTSLTSRPANFHSAGLAPPASTSDSIMGSRRGAWTGPVQPAFQLTLPASAPPREQPAPIIDEQPASATQENPVGLHALKPLVTMASPAEDPTYGRMAFEMRESMKRSKATVVFSPAALTGLSTPSSASNTPGGGPPNKRKAQSDLDDRSTKRGSPADSIDSAPSSQGANQNGRPRDPLESLLRPRPNEPLDWKAVQFLKRGVSVTIRQTLDVARDQGSVFGIPIWPNSFPLKPESQVKAREIHDSVVRQVIESILGEGSYGEAPMSDLSQSTGSTSSAPPPMITGNSAPTKSTPEMAFIPMPAPAAMPTSDVAQNAGNKNGTVKGLCVPNVVEVNGGVGLVINGGKGFVPLPGLPKSHQKKTSKNKVTEQATFNPSDSAALQDALRSNDMAKAQEIASRIFPPASAPAPDAPPKAPARKRATAKGKKTDDKKTGGKKKGNINQSPVSADDNVTNGVPQNQAQPVRGNFLPFPSAPPSTVNPLMDMNMDMGLDMSLKMGMDNQITDETLQSFDLDQFIHETIGTGGPSGSSVNVSHRLSQGADFDFDLPPVQSLPKNVVDLTVESEQDSQGLAPVGQGNQTFQQPNNMATNPEVPSPMNYFDEQFHLELGQKLDGVATAGQTAEPTNQGALQFQPFPTGDNISETAADVPGVVGVPATTPDPAKDTAQQTTPTCEVVQYQVSTPAAEVTQPMIPTADETATGAPRSQTPASDAAILAAIVADTPEDDLFGDTAIVADTPEDNLFGDTAVVADASKDALFGPTADGEYEVEDWFISQNPGPNPTSAIPRFIQDQALKFEWWQALADFCDVHKLPNPYHESYKVNATAPPEVLGPGGDTTRVWKSQDHLHCADLHHEDILWKAAVYTWNNAPARYRFATTHRNWPIEPITPRFFLNHGPVITLCRDPKLAERDPLRYATRCSWQDVKSVARGDGVFAGLVWELHPAYRQRVQWKVEDCTEEIHIRA